MKSPVIKRSIVITSHKTSVSLEDAFWNGLKEIAASRRTTLSALVAAIDSRRSHCNLSSAIRLFVLEQSHARKEGGADVGNGGSGHGGSENDKNDHGAGGRTPRRGLAVAPAAALSVLRSQ